MSPEGGTAALSEKADAGGASQPVSAPALDARSSRAPTRRQDTSGRPGRRDPDLPGLAGEFGCGYFADTGFLTP